MGASATTALAGAEAQSRPGWWRTRFVLGSVMASWGLSYLLLLGVNLMDSKAGFVVTTGSWLGSSLVVSGAFVFAGMWMSKGMRDQSGWYAALSRLNRLILAIGPIWMTIPLASVVLNQGWDLFRLVLFGVGGLMILSSASVALSADARANRLRSAN